MTESQPVNLKQRVIGAIVLVSLGIIFIPMFLNGGPDHSIDRGQSNIPQIPERLKKTLPSIPEKPGMPERRKINAVPVEVFTASENIQSPETTDAQDSQSKNIEQITESVPELKPVSKPNSRKIDTAYTIQIASFGKKTNAFALRDKLRKKGFKAYIEAIKTDKGQLYRLRAGPYLKYSQVIATQNNLKRQFKLEKTIIVKYET
jgi:DedD protein